MQLQGTHSKKPPKLVSAQVVGSDMSTNYIDPKMVGEVNEAAIEIECVPSTDLLDTGSCQLFQKLFTKNIF